MASRKAAKRNSRTGQFGLGNTAGGRPRYVKKGSGLHNATSGYKPQKQGRTGKNNKSGFTIKQTKVAVVPYARASLRSQTIGANAGFDVPGLRTKRRVSFGGYVRVERRQASMVENRIRNNYNGAVNKLVSKLSPNSKADPFVKKAVQYVAREQVNKRLGRQFRVIGTDSSFARLGTSRYGLPSVVVRKGRSRVSDADRAKGRSDFNRAMSNLQAGKKAARSQNLRAPRRTKNPQKPKVVITRRKPIAGRK